MTEEGRKATDALLMQWRRDTPEEFFFSEEMSKKLEAALWLMVVKSAKATDAIKELGAERSRFTRSRKWASVLIYLNGGADIVTLKNASEPLHIDDISKVAGAAELKALAGLPKDYRLLLSYEHTALSMAAIQADTHPQPRPKQKKKTKTRRYLSPNNALANKLTSIGIGSGEHTLTVGKTGRKGSKTVETIVALDYADWQEEFVDKQWRYRMSRGQTFAEFDRAVLDAVCSIYESGHDAFTIDMVARVLSGGDVDARVSRTTEKRIESSLAHLAMHGARITATDEIKMREKNPEVRKKAERTLRGGSLLPIAISTLWHPQNARDKLVTPDWAKPLFSRQDENGVSDIPIYYFLMEPILLFYARFTGQLVNVDAELLKIQEHVGEDVWIPSKTTERRQILALDMLRKISSMMSQRGLRNNHISLVSYDRAGKHHAGLYERVLKGEMDESTSTNTLKKTKARIREDVETILTYWVSRDFIAGFEFIKDGGEVKSIRIDIPKKQLETLEDGDQEQEADEE